MTADDHNTVTSRIRATSTVASACYIVVMPRPGEGVGEALRSIYHGPQGGMPAEFARLLDRLR